MSAVTVASRATRSVNPSAASMSGFWMACGTHLNVRPGGGNVYADCSVVNEYKKMSQMGTCRNRMAPSAVVLSHQGALSVEGSFILKRIEGSQLASDQEIDDHDDDRTHGECSSQRDVARCALIREDRLADKETGVAEQRWHDEV